MPLANRVGLRLKERGETIAIAESSSGGLISAALLAVPGASSYYLAGAVVYTVPARIKLMDLPKEAVKGLHSASEPYALLLARTARERFGATWGLSETGMAGPAAPLPDKPAGLTSIALAGPNGERALTIRTGSADRLENMYAFAGEALNLLLKSIS